MLVLTGRFPELAIACACAVSALVPCCAAYALPKPISPPCVAQNVIVIESDLYGNEIVRVVRYLACEAPRTPLDTRLRALCHEQGNPYRPVIWGRPEDRSSLEWLCTPPGEHDGS
jgi:hypothetical protein